MRGGARAAPRLLGQSENPMSTLLNRRRFPRFVLQPMYAPLSVRLHDAVGPQIDGHAYDISEGGVRFELDSRIAVGTPLSMQITIPTAGAGDLGPGHTITAFATVAWIEEEDEIPPFRCAAVFTGFAKLGDRERLLRNFSTGRYRMVG
jgi:hypothetical protein